MAQRQGQKRNRNRGGAQAPAGANGHVRSNNANGSSGAHRATAASTFTAETAREERARTTGRRARQRIAQEQAAKRRRLGIILGVAMAIVIVVIAVAGFLLNSGSKTAGPLNDGSKLNTGNSLTVGTKAPDFTLSTVGGKSYKLSALRGHPVLLEFFAVWCPHCQHEAPILNQLDKSYTSKGLQTLSILANQYGNNYELSGQTDTRPVDKSDISWFQSTFKVAHPMLIDPDFAQTNQYGASSYPTIYILDKNGVIRYTNGALGDIPYQTLAKAVDAAIKGQSTK